MKNVRRPWSWDMIIALVIFVGATAFAIRFAHAVPDGPTLQDSSFTHPIGSR